MKPEGETFLCGSGGVSLVNDGWRSEEASNPFTTLLALHQVRYCLTLLKPEINSRHAVQETNPTLNLNSSFMDADKFPQMNMKTNMNMKMKMNMKMNMNMNMNMNTTLHATESNLPPPEGKATHTATTDICEASARTAGNLDVNNTYIYSNSSCQGNGGA